MVWSIHRDVFIFLLFFVALAVAGAHCRDIALSWSNALNHVLVACMQLIRIDEMDIHWWLNKWGSISNSIVDINMIILIWIDYNRLFVWRRRLAQHGVTLVRLDHHLVLFHLLMLFVDLMVLGTAWLSHLVQVLLDGVLSGKSWWALPGWICVRLWLYLYEVGVLDADVLMVAVFAWVETLRLLGHSRCLLLHALP